MDEQKYTVVEKSKYGNGAVRNIYGPFNNYSEASDWTRFHERESGYSCEIFPLQFPRYLFASA